jgi:hypothetical protein
MAGRIELAATRIKNPKTGDMLVDGITSDNDSPGLQEQGQGDGAATR